MIYGFDAADSNVEKFISLLRQAAIDFEIFRYNGIVIHVLGNVEPNLHKQLNSLSGKRMVIENPVFSEFKTTKQPIIIAGPCAVESEQQLDEVTAFLSELGVGYLRGGAFKPRTSPDSFQGTGREGLKLLKQFAAKYNLKIVTEVMDRSQLGLINEVADIIQVGSRNMFNYSMLVALGAVEKPILLKRGMSATIEEWVESARYISKGGNDNILLCERGIRTFEPTTRNTLDISAIQLGKQASGYPVIADPSHAAGRADLVPSLTKAAIAAGADGVMIEIHPHPDDALSDKSQALSFAQFKKLVTEIRRLHSSF